VAGLVFNFFYCIASIMKTHQMSDKRRPRSRYPCPYAFLGDRREISSSRLFHLFGFQALGLLLTT